MYTKLSEEKKIYYKNIYFSFSFHLIKKSTPNGRFMYKVNSKKNIEPFSSKTWYSLMYSCMIWHKVYYGVGMWSIKFVRWWKKGCAQNCWDVQWLSYNLDAHICHIVLFHRNINPKRKRKYYLRFLKWLLLGSHEKSKLG